MVDLVFGDALVTHVSILVFVELALDALNRAKPFFCSFRVSILVFVELALDAWPGRFRSEPPP